MGIAYVERSGPSPCQRCTRVSWLGTRGSGATQQQSAAGGCFWLTACWAVEEVVLHAGALKKELSVDIMHG